MFSSFVAILPQESSLVISNPLVLDSAGPSFCMKQQLPFFFFTSLGHSQHFSSAHFTGYTCRGHSFASITIHLLMTPKFISPTWLPFRFQTCPSNCMSHRHPNTVVQTRNQGIICNFFSQRPPRPPLNILWQDVECGHGAPCHSEIQNCSTRTSGILFFVQNSY